MLSAQQLACLRGDRLLFKGIDIALNAGELLYVLGENGCGKSSLLRILCGLLSPNDGEVYWQQQSTKQVKEEYFSQLFYLGHLNGLKEDLTALENLRISMGLVDAQRQTYELLDALDAMGVLHCAHLPVFVLSQGQKRRVALAKLWLTSAKLWILDEPFVALDHHSIEVLSLRLSQHISSGGMAIITTHQEVNLHALSTHTLRLSA